MSKSTFLVEVTINLKLKVKAKTNRDARDRSNEIADASIRAFEDRAEVVVATSAVTVEAK